MSRSRDHRVTKNELALRMSRNEKEEEDRKLDGTRVGRGCECGAKHKTVVVDESINRVKIVTSITLILAK